MPNAEKKRANKKSNGRQSVVHCRDVKERKCKQDRRREKETMIDRNRRQEKGRGFANLYFKAPSDLTWFNTT